MIVFIKKKIKNLIHKMCGYIVRKCLKILFKDQINYFAFRAYMSNMIYKYADRKGRNYFLKKKIEIGIDKFFENWLKK
ncbi:MAG: hypothetical protein QXY70_01920 [Nanopusillaceae archaeon]